MEEIHYIASYAMELPPSPTVFLKKATKKQAWHVKMCNAAASEPAGSPGPNTFSKIQENDLLYSQNLVEELVEIQYSQPTPDNCRGVSQADTSWDNKPECDN